MAKQTTTKIAFFIITAVLLLMPTNAFSAENDENTNKLHDSLYEMINDAQIKPDTEVEIIIDTKDSNSEIISKLKEQNIRFNSYKSSAAVYAKVPKYMVNRLARLDSVNEIWPNLQAHLISENYENENENIAQIGADYAWNLGYDGTGVKVAVIDSGIDKEHSMFKDKIIAEKDFTNSTESRMDDKYGHGTHVAGIVAGNGKYKGVAPGASLMNAKIFDDEGYGTLKSVLEAIEWAIDNDADILSMSLTFYTNEEIPSLNKAIDDAIKKKIVVVAGAGNCGPCNKWCDGFEGVGGLGNYEPVITVGAVDKNNELACFSSFQNFKGYSKPEIMAPGVAVLSSLPNENYARLDGTSMATPHISGVAALLLQKNPKLSPAEIKRMMETTATDINKKGKDTETGYGVVNVTELFSSSIECYSDSDCAPENNGNEYECKNNRWYEKSYSYKCMKPGTENSVCQTREKKPVLKNTCKNGCSSEPLQCKNAEIKCMTDSDCGTNEWVRNPLCKNNDVYQYFLSNSCKNPGTENSFCSKSTKLLLKINCENKCKKGTCI